MEKYWGYGMLVTVSSDGIYIKLMHDTKIDKTDSDLYPVLFDLDEAKNVVGIEIILPSSR